MIIPSLVPAYHIAKRSRGDGLIEDEVNEILSVINEDIQQALELEKYSATTEIPTNFAIPEMSPARAQKFIYYHVLRALRKAGYVPKIRFVGTRAESQQVFIHTKWFTKEDEEFEDYMNKYIQAHDVSKKFTETDETDAPKPIRRRRRRL